MKAYKTIRYQCEFCGKRGGNKHHMLKHENSCTKNPFRQCRMCKAMGSNQRTMDDMIKLLPNPKAYEKLNSCGGVYYDNLEEAVNGALPALKKFTNDCPACILAAIRQAGIPVPIASDFDFKKECEAWWTVINEEHLEECNYGY